MKSSVKRAAGALAIGLLVFGAVSCSDDDTTSSGGGGGGAGKGGSSAEAKAARERVEPFLEPQTEILIKDPLESPVEGSKHVYFLPQNIESSAPLTKGMEAATEAIGWELTTIPFDSADPQGVVSAMTQAVEAKADYIAVVGSSAEAYGSALDQAKSAGIPVIDMYATDKAEGEANGIYANIGGPESSRNSYPYLADLVISDSDAKAHVLFVNIPDFPILQIADEATVGQFEKECPDCKVTKLDLSVTDLTSGNVASQVVSTLQTNPDINYIFTSFGDLSTGLPEALDGAGLGEQAKIVGNVPNLEQIQALVDDRSFAYIVLPSQYSSWAAVDAMIRLDQGIEIDQESHEVLPLEIWTNETAPDKAEMYNGPEGHAEQFKELWGVTAS